MPFDLEPETWATLARGIVRGEYNLLLGAGASMDSTDGSGDPLPSAQQFVHRLVTDFSIPTNPVGLSLSRAFEAAKSRSTTSGETLRNYLAKRFVGCSPAPWWQEITTMRWGAVWSLNIDDVVQRAYEAAGPAAEQALTTLDWTDLYRQPNWSANELLAVHLHGTATKLPDDGLDSIVFGIVEYLRAAEHRHSWHHVFSDTFQTRPFLVFGATLADEFDLAELLRRGNHAQETTGFPSFIVLRDVDDLQQQEFRSWGLIPVEITAEAFIDALTPSVREEERRYAAETPGRRDRLEQEATRFLRQFHRLRVDPRRVASPGHDLFAGHHPDWPDIVHNLDADFDVAPRLSTRIRECLDGEVTQSVSAILGPPFSGKSVALLRTARELLRGPYDVYMFDAEEGLDVEAALWWLKHDDQVVLLFDGAADQNIELASLAEKCEGEEVRLVVAVAERDSRRIPLFSALPPAVLRPDLVFETGRLSNHEIRALVQKLTESRRLGLLTNRSRREQEDYFRIECRRYLVEGMARLETGSGFVDRLTQQYAEIVDPAMRAAYGVACVAYVFGYAMPLGVLSSSCGLGSDVVLSACQPGEPLGDVLQLAGPRVRPHHRRLASLMVENVMTREQRYELSLALARNLAPYITRATIHQRTLPYRIARELMNARVATDWFGPDNAERWYSELADVYDWNARFWEQRALAAARAGRLDQAESFAEHAVQVHRDAFTLTTLGSILMHKSYEWVRPRSDQGMDYYRRGVTALSDANERQEGRLELPYQTFFQNTVALVEASGAPPDAELIDIWNRWDGDVGRVPLFAHARFADELAEFREKWLRLSVVDAPKSAD